MQQVDPIIFSFFNRVYVQCRALVYAQSDLYFAALFRRLTGNSQFFQIFHGAACICF